MTVDIKDLTVSFGDLKVLGGLDLHFPEKEISVVLGPSGCGKTTILNVLTSSVSPRRGSIEGIEGKRFSYLFQEPRLLPWLTVEGNLNFVLDDISDKREREALCRRVLKMTGLSDYASWYPGKLSGGMKQRVAIARAFAHPSDMILMDEPFQGLDLKRKLSLINQFTDVWEKEKRSAVMVTHDIGEAIRLADKVYVLTEKPARLADAFTIDIPRPEREPGTKRYSEYEKRLYDLLS
ncbi:ABC transporter ATP-binding protein [Spirochaeta isovalerica]|uniref:NitT/TauT family transport system ATP-binding protein n=1 Tax=Spirochaeta isovalerica TaxID=150 RepID=A0A841R9C3_9SPIO|nr:ABC transporter ATP-binding protein [Spirochaeta isovalerica]MBB6481924.1 NitT/TauT family transport system ATP-binding protein [Spirochaeta isovalerica]